MHLQVVHEEEEYAEHCEWVATGRKSHTFHIRPPVLLHNLLPYPVDVTYEVSALATSPTLLHVYVVYYIWVTSCPPGASQCCVPCLYLCT